jgi:hypothetical protein
LVPDIAVVKEAIKDKTITAVRRVRSVEMLANCLTKAGASGKELRDVIQSGKFNIPEGWLDV